MAERVACRGLWLECERASESRAKGDQRSEQEQHGVKEGRRDKEAAAAAASSALCKGEGRVAHA